MASTETGPRSWAMVVWFVAGMGIEGLINVLGDADPVPDQGQVVHCPNHNCPHKSDVWAAMLFLLVLVFSFLRHLYRSDDEKKTVLQASKHFVLGGIWSRFLIAGWDVLLLHIYGGASLLLVLAWAILAVGLLVLSRVATRHEDREAPGSDVEQGFAPLLMHQVAQ